MKPSELRNFLNHLCDLAKMETLSRFRSSAIVSNKREQGFDPVTEADREAERVIRDEIIRNWPQHGIHGEEHEAVNPEAEYQWIIDPIDGTRSFIAGIPLWGTLIGFYHNGRPLGGVMDQPFTGERFLSDGENATCVAGKNLTELKTSNVDLPSEAILMTTDPELHTGNRASAFENLKKQCKLTRYGTDCYAFGMLASGNVDLVIESGVQFYDIAALIPIVEMAGGVFTDWNGNSYPEGGNVIAAANPAIHKKALALLNT